jgi:hypothetical protein
MAGRTTVADSKKKTAKARKSTAKKKTGAKARSGDQAEPQVLHVSDLVSKAPFRGALTRVAEDEPTPGAAAAAAASRRDPVRAPIDRAVPPDVFSLDRLVRNPQNNKVVRILRRPLGFPSGSLPGDPGAFPPLFDASYGVCHVLASAAALRCAARGRYG